MEKVKDGYKTTELGEIPEEWEVKELNDITSVITKGTTPTTYGYDFEDEGINFIKIESINDMKGTLLQETFSKISEECHKKLSRSILEEDDILFAIAGATIGKCAITTKECLPANTNQALAIIRLNKNIDSKFIFHQLRGQLIQNKIENLKTNTAQPNLNLKQIGEFTILLPTLKEQQKLSFILNCVDEQIEITDNLIEKIKELKKGLMQNLLTKGIGHERFKETEIGSIPKEWEVSRFKDVVIEINQGINTAIEKTKFVDNGIPMLKAKDINNHKVNLNKVDYISVERYENYSDRYRLKKGDVLFTNIGSDLGKASVFNSDIACSYAWNVMRIKRNESIESEFLFYLMNSNYFYRDISKRTKGTGMGFVSKDSILSILVAIPSLKEQKQISLILSSVDEKINQYESKKEKLQVIKKGLMQKLLTGKIRVKV